MSRRCSHCSHIGHNTRTCPNRGVKLFGVRLTEGEGTIRKSASMGNLTNFPGLNQPGSSNPGSLGDTPDNAAPDGYASEDFVPGSSSTSRERKKRTPCRWTEEEHSLFLLGLQNHRRGDWRGIARNYVVSRTPSQIASHAKNYFIKVTNVPRWKRRTSVFDIVADEVADALMAEQDFLPANQPQPETEGNNPLPNPSTLDKEVHVMDSVHADDGESASLKLDSSQSSYPAVCTPYFYPPLPQPYWPGYNPDPTKKEAHKVVKPTPVHLKSSINVDELVGMSNLSLGDSIGDSGTSSLSLKLLEGPSRQSAFHATPRPGSSDANGSGVNPV